MRQNDSIICSCTLASKTQSVCSSVLWSGLHLLPDTRAVVTPLAFSVARNNFGQRQSFKDLEEFPSFRSSAMTEGHTARPEDKRAKP